MNNIRIAILDAYDNVLAYIDNSSNEALHFYKDELHTYLSGSAYTFSFTTLQMYEDSKHLVVGNKLAFRYKNKDYYCNIVNVENDGTRVKIISYGLSFELINEETGTYKSNGAMSFTDYIKAFNFENHVFEIGINEVSDKRISHEWEGTETVLARLFSLANVFNAEIEFVPELNSNYSLKRIVMNVYREHDIGVQGMGKDKRSEVIRYGYSIKNITKTSDITELYTAIRPTGKDGLTLAGINKQEYDSNGNLEYSSPGGVIEILAPQARDRFPSNLMSGLNDRYIAKVWSYETDNVNTLYGQALAQLKKNCVPQISYNVDGYIDAEIGDTFTIEDTEYKPTLYLEARITEQVISFTDRTRNKTTFDNFKEVQSQISNELIDKMNAMIEANRLFKGEIISSNGIVFKEESDSTVLEALVSDGVKDVTSTFRINWYKDNELIITSNSTVEVLATDLQKDRSVFRFEALNDFDVIKARAEVTVSKISDGVDGITLYPHVMYSNNPDGDPMTSNSADAIYIGVCVSESSTPPTDYKTYSWSKIKGDDGLPGEDGKPGADGADGKPSYNHFAYSNSADGKKDFSLTDSNREYIGVYSDENEASSSDPSKYQWTKIKGDKGEDAPVLYTWLRYADTPTSGISDSPEGKNYLGIAENQLDPTPSDNYEDYNWSLIKGFDADPFYTWFMYADDALGTNMSADPTDKPYMGIAENRANPTPSNNPQDYNWIKVIGSNGNGLNYYQEQFYLSTSKTSQVGGSWVDVQPVYVKGRFYWKRVKTIWDDGTVEYTDPILMEAFNYSIDQSQEALKEIISAKAELEKDIDVVQATANGKNSVFYQTTAPATSGRKVNDIWYDTDDGNKMYYFNGTKWNAVEFGSSALSDSAITADKIAGDVNAKIEDAFSKAGIAVDTANTANTNASGAVTTANTAKANASSALTTANTAKTTAESANSKATTAQNVADSAKTIADTVTALVNNNKNSWDQAPSALATANGKNTVFYQNDMPSTSGRKTNDIWFDTNDGGKMYYFNGSAWVAQQFGSNALVDNAITANKIASDVNTKINTAYSNAGIALADASNAQKTADQITKLVDDNKVSWDKAPSALDVANTVKTAVDTNKVNWDKAPSALTTAQSAKSAADTVTSLVNANKVNWDKAPSALATANGKNSVFYQTTAPATTGRRANDIWYDIDDGNRMYYFNGTSWIAVQFGVNAIANDAITADKISNAVNTAISKAQTDATKGITDANSALKAAQTAQSSANAAQSSANNAQTTADGKNTVFYQATAPSTAGRKANDVWYDIDDSNKMYYWNGSVWVALQFGINAIANDAITADKISDAVNNAITKAQTDATKGITDAASALAAAQSAQSSANSAQTTANGKNTVFYATAAPATSGRKLNDVWFDTDDGNRMYYWNGTAWNAQQFGTNAIKTLSITDALIANATISNGKIANLDAAKITTGILAADRIGAKTIAASKLIANTITADSGVIADAAIKTAMIANLAVTNAQIANGTIITAKIANAAITTALIADAAINNAKIANLDAGKVTTGTLSADRIGARTIGANKLIANTITADSGVIANAAIKTAMIANLAVGSAQIADAAITNAKIADLAVTNAKIADATIQNAKIANLDAAKITTGILNADRIAAGTLTIGKLNSDVQNTINVSKTQQSNFGYRYYYKLVVKGESNKYYPVVFRSGNQDVMREIFIKRSYSEQAPSDWNGHPTSKGISLNLKLKCNFGGWGGVKYSWLIHDFEEEYGTTFGGKAGNISGIFFYVYLRGGGTTGAVYHIYSDQPIEQTSYGYSSPQICYSSDRIGWSGGTSSAPTYSWNAPAPITTPDTATIRSKMYARLAQEVDGYIANWCYNNDKTYINGGKIYTGSVTANQIAANAIVAGKIAANAVSAENISSGSITADKIATNAITAVKIAAGVITGDKLVANTITGDKISTNTINADRLISKTITAASGVIADAAIVTANIANLAVTTAKIANLAIGTAQIADAAINNAKIANLAITDAKIANATISSGKIANLDAGKITSGYIAAARIQAGTITADKLVANSITANQIASGAVSADELAANAVTATKILAGSITADRLKAGTITATSGVIANAAIGTALIADLAVTGAKIANATIGTAKIANASITNALIADASITNAKIADATIQNAKIANLDAAKITTGTLNAARIAAGTITADKLNIASQGFAKYPNFSNWTGTFPYGLSDWSSSTSRIAKVAVNALNVIQMTTGTSNTGLTIGGSASNSGYFNYGLNLDGVGYVAVEIKFRLTSGTNPSGAGALLDFYYKNTAGTQTYSRVVVKLSDVGTSLSANTWYTLRKVYAVPSTITSGQFTFLQGYLMGNYSECGALTSKTIQFASFNVYNATYQDYLTQSWTSGTSINGGYIATNTITANQIAANAITASELATNSVTAVKIAANAVTADKIIAGAVNADKIASNAVTTVKISAGAVNADKIATNAITAVKISAGAVTTDKIASNAITAVKIAAGQITAEKIASSAVSADKIAANAVTAAKIATDAIKSRNYVANSAGSFLNLATGAFDSKNLKWDSAGNIIAISGKIGNVSISNGGLSSSKKDSNNLTTSYYLNSDGTIVSEQTGGEMNYLLSMDYGMIDLSATPNDGTTGSWSRHKGVNISGGLINFYSGTSESVASIDVDTTDNCIRIINGGHEQPIFELVETVNVEI